MSKYWDDDPPPPTPVQIEKPEPSTDERPLYIIDYTRMCVVPSPAAVADGANAGMMVGLAARCEVSKLMVAAATPTLVKSRKISDAGYSITSSAVQADSSNHW